LITASNPGTGSIYTDDKDALRDAVRHARIRKTASDYWHNPQVALASR